MDSITKSDDYQIRCIINEIIKGKNIILHGPGGTGKTYSIKKIASGLVGYGKRVSCTATTGIASINLNVPEKYIIASTLHRWAGVGLAQLSADILSKKVLQNKKACIRWRTTDILILDEVSMLGADFFDKLDIIGKFIRSSSKPFGGLQLILSGDFLQLPPVKDGWSFESKVWQTLNLVPFIFKEAKRYDDEAYFNLLLRVRENKQTADDVKKLRIRCKAYKKLQEILTTANTETIIKPTILYSLRADVDSYNKAELDKLEGKETEYTAFDQFEGDVSQSKVEDYKKLLDDAMPEKIILKKGAQVMLKVNLDVDLGLVNGSRGVIMEIEKNQVHVRFINGIKMYVGFYSWKIEDKNGSAIRSQMPFILAYSLSIHKSQGCTLDYAVCDLGSTVFAKGQAYVALSRVRNLRGLFLSSFSENCISTDAKASKYAKCLEEIEKTYNYCPITQEEWEKITKCKFNMDSESDSDISYSEVGELLSKLGIDTKDEWKEWLKGNHVDKGGDEEICKIVINEGRARGW